MIYTRPPIPAIAPPTIVATYLYKLTFIPAASAVAGDSPTALKFNPTLVFFKTICIHVEEEPGRQVNPF